MNNRRLLSTTYLLCFLVIYINAKRNAELKCTKGVEKKMRVAHCDDSDGSKFPKDLDSGIEALYLNHTELEEINDGTFEKLKSLKHLFMDHNGQVEISTNAFKPLSNLIELDLSFIRIPDIYLPPTLQKLYLNQIKKKSIPISKILKDSLEDLQLLSLRDNDLDQIPSFGHALPSLSTLDLSGNELTNFKFDSLADLCNLKLLAADKIQINDNCECLQLKKWSKDKNIEIKSSFSCRSSRNSDQNCDTSQQSNDFLQKYKSCEDEASRIKSKKTLGLWLYICGIILAVIVICFSCMVLYVSCNRKDYSDSSIRAYFCCKKRTTLCEPEEGTTEERTL